MEAPKWGSSWQAFILKPRDRVGDATGLAIALVAVLHSQARDGVDDATVLAIAEALKQCISSQLFTLKRRDGVDGATALASAEALELCSSQQLFSLKPGATLTTRRCWASWRPRNGAAHARPSFSSSGAAWATRRC